MRLSRGTCILALAILTASRLGSQQLREDSYTWYVGATGGALFFETQSQERSSIPSTGFQALILARRAALQISIEESFGSNEASAFGSSSSPTGSYVVTFDRLRKYSAILTAFPVRGTVEPYLGVGWGILHTVNTEVEGLFASPEEAAAAHEEAVQRGSTGFWSLVGGLQGRLMSTVVLFGQYQVTSSPSGGNLLVGPSHGITFGLRVSLGGAKEGIRGGGY
jgi:hypothetical protein